MSDKQVIAAAAAVLLLVLLAKRKAGGAVPIMSAAQVQRDAWLSDFMATLQQQEAEFKAGSSLRFDPADFAGALGS